MSRPQALDKSQTGLVDLRSGCPVLVMEDLRPALVARRQHTSVGRQRELPVPLGCGARHERPAQHLHGASGSCQGPRLVPLPQVSEATRQLMLLPLRPRCHSPSCRWLVDCRRILASGGGTADRTIKFWNTGTNVLLNSVDTGSQVRYRRVPV